MKGDDPGVMSGYVNARTPYPSLVSSPSLVTFSDSVLRYKPLRARAGVCTEMAGEGHVSWPGVACIATGALFGYSSRAFKRCVSPATTGPPRSRRNQQRAPRVATVHRLTGSFLPRLARVDPQGRQAAQEHTPVHGLSRARARPARRRVQSPRRTHSPSPTHPRGWRDRDSRPTRPSRRRRRRPVRHARRHHRRRALRCPRPVRPRQATRRQNRARHHVDAVTDQYLADRLCDRASGSAFVVVAAMARRPRGGSRTPPGSG